MWAFDSLLLPSLHEDEVVADPALPPRLQSDMSALKLGKYHPSQEIFRVSRPILFTKKNFLPSPNIPLVAHVYTQSNPLVELSEAVVSTEIGLSREEEKLRVVTENLKTIIPLVQGVRSVGASAMDMALVALGGTDAFYEFGLHAWDMAAGDLLIREAGGVIMDPSGGPFDLMSRRVLCAATNELADQLRAKLQQYYPLRDL
ncbi:Inositol monophosphatase 2 [Homalodisca vitripennis]|nr:Inositol monophosphatase 2 [Homalodisca vitripennis]